jgi:hypothetical protein
MATFSIMRDFGGRVPVKIHGLSSVFKRIFTYSPGARITLTLSRALATALLVSSCASGVQSPPGTTGPAAAPKTAAAMQDPPPLAPLIVEGVKVEFWQDYSFVSSSNSPLTVRALAEINANSSYGQAPPPIPVILANAEWIQVTVAGGLASPVTINEMQVVKTCRKPSPGGTLFYSPTNGAGPFPVRAADKVVSAG